MNRNDTLQFLDAAEALLAAHRNDGQPVGWARTQAKCKFARQAYPALELACEMVRKLVADVRDLQEQLSLEVAKVTELKTDVELNAQMLAHQCDLAREAESKVGVLKSMHRDAESVKAIQRREIKALKDQLRLARMRATARGGSVL